MGARMGTDKYEFKRGWDLIDHPLFFMSPFSLNLIRPPMNGISKKIELSRVENTVD